MNKYTGSPRHLLYCTIDTTVSCYTCNAFDLPNCNIPFNLVQNLGSLGDASFIVLQDREENENGNNQSTKKT